MTHVPNPPLSPPPNPPPLSSDHHCTFVRVYGLYIYEGGPPKTRNLFMKNCVFGLTLNFSTLHVMQYTYWDFFPPLKTVLNSLILMSFKTSAFVVVVSPLPHQQNISLWVLFSSGETKISVSEQDQVNKGVGHGSQASFGSKTAEHSVQHRWVHW